MNANQDISLWVDAERRQSPPSGCLERDWEKLRDALNQGQAATIRSIDARILTPPGGTWHAAKWWLATVGIGVGLGLGFGFYRTPGSGQPRVNDRVSAATHSLSTEHSTTSVHEERSDTSLAGAGIRVGTDVTRTPEPVSTSGRAWAPAGSAATPRSKDNAGDTQIDDEFALELALIRRAKTALDDGNAREASALIEEHRHRYPKGVFAAEREALRVLALCQADISEKARRAARDFLVSHPRSLHEDRVRRACGLGK